MAAPARLVQNPAMPGLELKPSRTPPGQSHHANQKIVCRRVPTKISPRGLGTDGTGAVVEFAPGLKLSLRIQKTASV
jgi:hypothetical protein